MEDKELEEKIESILSQYAGALLGGKAWGLDAVEKTHNLKLEAIRELCALKAEVSHRAAIKEVVDWMKRLYHYYTFFPVSDGTQVGSHLSRTMIVKNDEWEAKIKSWQVE